VRGCPRPRAADLSGRQPPNSPRPPLAQCGEAEFLDDVCAFLTGKRGKRLTRAAFPDAQVRNGFLLFCCRYLWMVIMLTTLTALEQIYLESVSAHGISTHAEIVL